MKIELIDGKITFSLADVLAQMPSGALVQAIQTLSCEDEVIRHVSEQIIGGGTDDGYCGARFACAQPNPHGALDIAIRRVAEASGDVAKAEIAALASELASVNKRLREAYDEIAMLQRSKDGRRFM